MTLRRRGYLVEAASDEDMLLMYQDNIATRKSQGQPVPRQWITNMAKLQAKMKGGKTGDSWVYSDEVFGHPSATNIAGYQNLIPIRVKRGDVQAVDRKIQQAQRVVDKLQAETGKVHAIVNKHVRATLAQVRAAKKKMSSQNYAEKEAILDMLRKETMPELYNLEKEVAKRH
jgi:hypothetical protein